MSLEDAVQDAADGLDGIVSAAENFVTDRITGGIFGNGWNDACGQKIGAAVVECVQNAVDERLRIYDCKSKLEGILCDLLGIESVIDAVKKELQ